MSAGSRGALPALVLALALALAAGPASALQSHPFKEVFGSAEQPSFAADRSLAVDQSSEDLYVLDSTEDALYRFNPDGTPANFAALGSNVIDGEGAGDETPEGDLAFASSGGGEQVAIDDSGGATDGNVYVTQSERDVVDVFSSAGAYLGRLSASAELGAFGRPCGVAVDEAGTVYVGDDGGVSPTKGRIHVFEPAANPPVNGDNTASYATLTRPCTLAAGAGATAGFLFVAAGLNITALYKLDAATGEVEYEIAKGRPASSVDPATGHVFATIATSGFGSSSAIGRYDASGAAEAELLATIKPGDALDSVAVNGTSGEIYLSRAGTENVEVYDGSTIVAQPEPTTEAASGLVGKNATLNGSVNPDGVELGECFFEWGPTTAYGEVAPCAESPAEIGSGTSPVAVHAEIAGLDIATAYHFRLVADNPESSPAAGADRQFTTADPVLSEPASGITDTEATLNGSVNPDGEEPSECFFEWGLTDEYGETAPCVPGPGAIGSGSDPVAVEAGLAGLNVGTVYHYRLVAVFSGGPLAGDGETFQTLGPVIGKTWVGDVGYSEAKLKAEVDPEGAKTTYRFQYLTRQAYEEQEDSFEGPATEQTPERLAGSDSTAHEVTAPIAGLAPGADYHYRVVATSADAVSTGPDRVLRTYEPLVPETGCPNQGFRGGPAARLPDCRAYELVSSPNKEGAIIEYWSLSAPGIGLAGIHIPLAAEDGEAAAYQAWDTFSEGQPVANNFTNDHIARRGPGGWSNLSLTPPNLSPFGINFASIGTYTPDLGALTMKGPLNASVLPESSRGSFNILHRRTAPEGVWRQASLNVPGDEGEASSDAISGGRMSADGTHVVLTSSYSLTGEGPGTFLWREAAPAELVKLPTSLANGGDANFRHAISEDGSRLFTSSGVIIDLGPEQSAGVFGFEYASLDGSVAFFSEGGDLHRWDVDADQLVQLTEGAKAVTSPTGFKALGGAEDGSRLYFVGTGAIAPGAEAGKLNLYLWSEDGTPDGDITYIATGERTGKNPKFDFNTVIDGARFSEDGRYLVFAEKVRNLTGYPHEGNSELYLYDAVEEELKCASCIPSGEPAGSGANFPFGISFGFDPRAEVVSSDGRVFFDTADALLPWDVNGRSDAYEYDSEGGGLSLLTSGTHREDSFLVGIGVSGRDAFFTTAESLVGIDTDGVHDVYDARSGGGIAAQNPAGPPAPCLGEACQNVPSVPELPTPASATFRGPGDPVAQPNCGARSRRAARKARRAKRVREAARRSAAKRRSGQLRRRSARLAKQAERTSRRASRCRRANRRAGG